MVELARGVHAEHRQRAAAGTGERDGGQLPVELQPRDAESWLGLAASYDRLKRFDLADRAYHEAIKLVGATPEIMNNQGFSYMLRGDYRRARATLLAARAKDPKSPYIANNLRLLDESASKAKAIN